MAEVYGATAGSAGRYHRAADRRPDLGHARHARPGRASAWSRSRSATSTTSRAVAFDDAVWRWTITQPIDDAGLRAWLDAALANAAAGTEVPFATSTSPRTGRSAAAGS